GRDGPRALDVRRRGGAVHVGRRSLCNAEADRQRDDGRNGRRRGGETTPHRRAFAGLTPAAPKYCMVSTKLPSACRALNPSSQRSAVGASTMPKRTAFSARRSRKLREKRVSVVSW